MSPYVQGQPGSGEAPLDEAGLGLDLPREVPDDLDQVAEASDGEVGQHAALEHRPDPFQRVEIRGVGGRLVHPQPGLGARGGSRLGGSRWRGAAIGGSLLNWLFVPD